VDVVSGKELSQTLLSDYVGASAAVLNGRAFVGTYGNQVLCVDLNASKVVWRYEHPTRKFPYYASPAVTDGLVIVAGRDKMVHALDPKEGAVLWTHLARSRFESSPVVVDTRVFIGSTGGKVLALDLGTGAVVWEFVVGADIVASPSVSDGKLVIGATDGTLYCFGRKAN